MELHESDERRLATRDISGYRIFSAGALGEAHALAHRALDLGRHDLGYLELGAWLSEREGKGSQWVHLQWHMLVFELGVGRRDEARARFSKYLEPVASGAEALTDAPAALWLLRLTDPNGIELPWDGVRRAALDHLGRSQDPFVVLHHLLALAGAGDTRNIERWVLEKTGQTSVDRVLVSMGCALAAYANGDHARAAQLMRSQLSRLRTLGGSHAQGDLFRQLYRSALAKSVGRSGLDSGAADDFSSAPISTN